jgi:anhydro-N-acetylmuramic acid kinase
LRHPFFRKPPPKSTGREMFGEEYFAAALRSMRQRRMNRFDIVRTLTELTARSIVLNYSLHLAKVPSEIVLTGGGAKNRALVEAIQREFERRGAIVAVTDSRAFHWPLQTIEPAAFALLAYLRANRLPGNIPETTGARRLVVLGQLSEA